MKNLSVATLKDIIPLLRPGPGNANASGDGVVCVVDFNAPPPYLVNLQTNAFTGYLALLLGSKCVTFPPVRGYAHYLTSCLGVDYRSDAHIVVPFLPDIHPFGSVVAAFKHAVVTKQLQTSSAAEEIFWNLAFTSDLERNLPMLGEAFTTAALCARLNRKAILQDPGLRKRAQFSVLPGVVLPRGRSAALASIRELMATHRRVWLKSVHGEGGDLVFAVEDGDQVPDRFDQLMLRIKQYLDQHSAIRIGEDYGDLFEIYAEPDVSLVIAAELGSHDGPGRLFDVNLQIVVHTDGVAEIGHTLQQTTLDGGYVGNASIPSFESSNPDFCSFLRLARIQAEIFGSFAYELGYRGFVGLDIKGSADRAFIVDPNCRINGSTPQIMLANLRHKPFSLGATIKFGRTIASYDEAIEIVGRNLCIDLSAGRGAGVAILAFRPSFDRALLPGDIVRANAAKAVILADNESQLSGFTVALHRAGFLDSAFAFPNMAT